MITEPEDINDILKEKNLNIDNEIRVSLRRAIKESVYSREQIVERMSLLTGKNITKAQLDSWTAESKRAYNFPVAYLPAFVISCGCEEIMEFLSQQSGGQFIRPDKLRSELFEIEKSLDILDIRRKEILKHLFSSEMNTPKNNNLALQRFGVQAHRTTSFDVSQERNSMSIDFPKKDHFLDFEGKEREFEYLIYETGTGFMVRAKETKETGYEFHAFSETNPLNALGELRQKIRKRLSTRYLQKEKRGYSLYHDEAKGQISYGGVIVDGVFIPFDQFNEMIQTYEGFYIEIKIKSLNDE